MSLWNLALVDLYEGKAEAAAEGARRSVAHLTDKVGPAHPFVSDALEVQGRALNAQKKHAEAVPLLMRAVAIREKAFGPEDSMTGSVLLRLGESHLGLGHPEAARPLLERAVAIRDKMTESDPLETGEPKLALARALWETGERPRARKLAEEARVAFMAAGPRAARQRGEAEDWLTRAR
jgi:hypothetical protein